MSEEEKKAVEELKILKNSEYSIMLTPHGADVFLTIIEKQQKENEQLRTEVNSNKKEIETLLNEYQKEKHKKTYARQNIIFKNKQLGQIRKNNKELKKRISQAEGILYEYLNNLYPLEELELQGKSKHYDDKICEAYFILKGE